MAVIAALTHYIHIELSAIISRALNLNSNTRKPRTEHRAYNLPPELLCQVVVLPVARTVDRHELAFLRKGTSSFLDHLLGDAHGFVYQVKLVCAC